MMVRVDVVAALNGGETVSEVTGIQQTPLFTEIASASILLTAAMP